MDNWLNRSKIVKINNPNTSIDWHFGNYCQNACSYCPEFLHSGDSKKFDLDVLQKFVLKVEENLKFTGDNKKIIFTFSGGEPTINSSFGPLVKWLKDRGHIIYVVTNGGRTLRWWEDWWENFDSVVLSFHTEYTDLDKFAEIADFLSKRTQVEVHLIAWPEYFERISEAHEKLSKIDNIGISIKRIHKSWVPKHNSFRDYTIEESNWINQNVRIGKSSFSGKKSFVIETEDGRVLKNLAPVFITNSKVNNFYGWKCNLGISDISISAYGDVYGAHCRQLLMGSIYEPEKIYWVKEPSICEKVDCFCMSDIIISKEKI
jgi:organic radical activating enzyme